MSESDSWFKKGIHSLRAAVGEELGTPPDRAAANVKNRNNTNYDSEYFQYTYY